MYPVDAQYIRSLAIKARDGDNDHGPTTSASVIGGRIVEALEGERTDPQSDDPTRTRALANILGLATQGGTSAGKRLLREDEIKVTRRGNVVSISTGWAVAATVAENGQATGSVDAADDGDPGPSPVVGRRPYVQFDFMSWAMFHHVHAKLRVKLAGLGAQNVTFEEVAKLEKLYPDCTVGEAMRRAGLDSTTLEIDLDGLKLDDDTAADAQG